MKKIILIGLVMVLLVNGVFGETSSTTTGGESLTLKGRVIDANTKEGVFANVNILVSNAAVSKTYNTNPDGRFEVTGLFGYPVSMNIKIEAEDYFSKELNIALTENTDLGDIPLSSTTPSPVKPVTPISDYDQYVKKEDFDSLRVDNRNIVSFYWSQLKEIAGKDENYFIFNPYSTWVDNPKVVVRKGNVIELCKGTSCKSKNELELNKETSTLNRDTGDGCSYFLLKNKEEKSIPIEFCYDIDQTRPQGGTERKVASIDNQQIPVNVETLSCIDSVNVVPGVNAPSDLKIESKDWCFSENKLYNDGNCESEKCCKPKPALNLPGWKTVRTVAGKITGDEREECKKEGKCKDDFILVKDGKEIDCWDNIAGLCLEGKCTKFGNVKYNDKGIAEILSKFPSDLYEDNDRVVRLLDLDKNIIYGDKDKVVPAFIKILQENKLPSKDRKHLRYSSLDEEDGKTMSMLLLENFIDYPLVISNLDLIASNLPNIGMVRTIELFLKNPLFNRIYNHPKINTLPDYERGSIAFAAFRLTDGTEKFYAFVDQILDFILVKRKEFADKIILGPDVTLIPIVGEEFEFKFNGIRNFAIKRGVTKIPDSVLKDEQNKGKIKKLIRESSGLTTIWFGLHGGPESLGSSWGFEEVGDLIIERGKIEEVVFIFDSCYGYDYAQNLIKYLKEKDIKVLPTIITSANKGKISWGDYFSPSLFIISLEKIDLKEGEPLMGGHIYLSEKFAKSDNLLYSFPGGLFQFRFPISIKNPLIGGYSSQDPGIFFNGLEISMNNPYHECPTCEGDNCPTGIASIEGEKGSENLFELALCEEIEEELGDEGGIIEGGYLGIDKILGYATKEQCKEPGDYSILVKRILKQMQKNNIPLSNFEEFVFGDYVTGSKWGDKAKLLEEYNKLKENEAYKIVERASELDEAELEKIREEVQKIYGVSVQDYLDYISSVERIYLVNSLLNAAEYANNNNHGIEVKPELLYAVANGEGLDKLLNSKKINAKSKMDARVLGLNSFGAELKELKENGFLDNNYRGYSSGVFSNLDNALKGLAATLASKQNKFLDYAKSIGLDKNDFTEDELNFWTYAYYINPGFSSDTLLSKEKGKGREFFKKWEGGADPDTLRYNALLRLSSWKAIDESEVFASGEEIQLTSFPGENLLEQLACYDTEETGYYPEGFNVISGPLAKITGKAEVCLDPKLEEAYRRMSVRILDWIVNKEVMSVEEFFEVHGKELENIGWDLNKLKKTVKEVGNPELMSLVLSLNDFEKTKTKPAVFIKKSKEGNIEKGVITNTNLNYEFNVKTKFLHIYPIIGEFKDRYFEVKNEEFWKLFEELRKGEYVYTIDREEQWWVVTDEWKEEFKIKELGEFSEIYNTEWKEGEWKGPYATKERFAVLLEGFRRGEDIEDLAPGISDRISQWIKEVWGTWESGINWKF